MRRPLKVRVRGRQLACLQRMYDETPCPRTRIRVPMVLLAQAGDDVSEIAAVTQQSDETVRRWLQRFEQEGCRGLLERVHPGRPPALGLRVKVFLRACLEHSPRAFGFHRPTWTTALLATLVARCCTLAVSDECVRPFLQTIERVCRRPSWTVKHLAQQQPSYAQKKPRSQGFDNLHHAVLTSTLKMKPN